LSTFCTISTFSHLFKTYALADSLHSWGGSLSVLLVDDSNSDICEIPANVTIFRLEDLKDELALKIIGKYRNESDKLRWSLKPIFLNYILKANDKVIYIDNDIFFFDNFTFLFEKLELYDILLTPHFYPQNPLKNQNWFEANFKVGLYNAGFIACNQKAISALDWWAKACLYRCEKNAVRGLWDDQKYLDLMPIVHSNTFILTHKGCNVAEWNALVCPKTIQNNKIIVDNQYPLIFYHFNYYSIAQILLDDNHVMTSSLMQYERALKKYNPSFYFDENANNETLINKIKLFVWEFLNKLNERTYS
jgi:hypothetical protein